MPKVSAIPRDAVKDRLAAVWAATVPARGAAYPTLPTDDVSRLTSIDWTGQVRTQVIIGQVDVSEVEQTSSFAYPLVTIYAVSSSAFGDNRSSCNRWAGDVVVIAEFTWSWRRSRALPDFESNHDLLEDVLVEILHDPTWMANPGAGLSYRGDMVYNRGAMSFEGENWRQTAVLTMTFGVEA